MNNISFNTILNRDEIKEEIISFLLNFEAEKQNIICKRGLYIYGSPGSGKTEFVLRLLKELNYDIIKYDTSDVRNKNVIETLTKENMADKSVINLLNKKKNPIVIVMDEIDGMNNGDKGGINSLIKLIRPKKTKKQKKEDITYTPIICISNYYTDKKIKELMKVCNIFELNMPTNNQIKQIINITMSNIDDEDLLLNNIINYIDGDLRKLNSIYNIYKNNYNILKNNIIQNIFKQKSYNNDTKEITKLLINQKFSIEEHNTIMNETDRTIVGLLWHENIVDSLIKYDNNNSIPLYSKILDTICFSDYIDRITFQKQIWQFNEMSSLIKTFHCNKMFHDAISNNNTIKNNTKNNAIKNNTKNNTKNNVENNKIETRFTKVLTKYSTEYNNSLFIQNICQQLSLDKKDVFSFFLELRKKHLEEEIYTMFDLYDINKLDINRLYRYLDKNISKENIINDETVSSNDFINYNEIEETYEDYYN